MENAEGTKYEHEINGATPARSASLVQQSIKQANCF